MDALMDQLTSGSSPLARGLLPQMGGQAVSTVDHPRSRGVYLLALCDE